jgi:hypothetical protein
MGFCHLNRGNYYIYSIRIMYPDRRFWKLWERCVNLSLQIHWVRSTDPDRYKYKLMLDGLSIQIERWGASRINFDGITGLRIIGWAYNGCQAKLDYWYRKMWLIMLDYWCRNRGHWSLDSYRINWVRNLIWFKIKPQTLNLIIK